MTEDAAPAPVAGRRRRAPTVLLLAVAVAAVVAVVVLGLEVRDGRRLDTERGAVLHAARQSALNLTSIDHRTAGRDIDRVLAGATGELAEQFEQEKDQLAQVLAGNRATSRGQVLGAGVVRLDGRSATVLVAVDATVTSNETAGQAARLQRYRMSLELRRVGGRWLTERVLFAGAPS